MDGSAIGGAPAHDKLGRFTRNHTEYHAKKRRVAERLAQLVAEYDTSPAYVQLLAIVARHLDDAERGRTALVRTRALNAANKVLRAIPRSQPARRPTRSLQEALAKAAAS